MSCILPTCAVSGLMAGLLAGRRWHRERHRRLMNQTITILGTIQTANVYLTVDSNGAEVVDFLADFDIDGDGSGGNPHHDPCFQPDTTLHHAGQALNAERVPFVVVPPLVCQRTRGMVLGCLAVVTYRGRRAEAVVGDLGPAKKVGEGSPELARRLRIDPNPNHGGTDEFAVHYTIYVDVPAVIDGVTYQLRPLRG